MAEAIRYTLSRWQGLCLFLDDGRVEIDNNVVERAIRPLALTRKNALFAGSDTGAEHWAVIASLIATCKLVDIEPYRYLADVITRIIGVCRSSRAQSRGLKTTLTFKLGATFALSSLSPAVIVRAWRSCQLPAISANVGEGVR